MKRVIRSGVDPRARSHDSVQCYSLLPLAAFLLIELEQESNHRHGILLQIFDSVLFFLFLVVLAPLLYFVYIASSLIALLFEDGLRDSVTLAAIEAHGNSSSAFHPIPKIIHQTWKNNNIPEQWQIAQFTWYGPNVSIGLIYLSLLYSLDLHPDYHYMVLSISSLTFHFLHLVKVMD